MEVRKARRKAGDGEARESDSAVRSAAHESSVKVRCLHCIVLPLVRTAGEESVAKVRRPKWAVSRIHVDSPFPKPS